MIRSMPMLLMALFTASCATQERFNILLISLDTLRPDHLTLYGYERDTSPHLERLAAEGVVFDRAFSQSPKTATSHMTLFTGLYPSVHGIENLSERNRRLSAEIPTLATLLSQAGYRTEAVVGGGNVAGELGFDQGFDLYAGSADAEDMFRQAHEVVGLVDDASGLLRQIG